MLGGGGREPCDGLASHPGGVEIRLVASCFRNRDKFRPDGTQLARMQTLRNCFS